MLSGCMNGVRQVAEAGAWVWVVVHVFDDGREDCALVDATMARLARLRSLLPLSSRPSLAAPLACPALIPSFPLAPAPSSIHLPPLPRDGGGQGGGDRGASKKAEAARSLQDSG